MRYSATARAGKPKSPAGRHAKHETPVFLGACTKNMAQTVPAGNIAARPPFYHRTFRPCNDSSRHAPSAHRQNPKLHLCCQGGDTCVYPLLENPRQVCAEKVSPRVAPPVYPNRGLYCFTQTPLPIRVRRHETPGAIRVTLPIPPIPRERRA